MGPTAAGKTAVAMHLAQCIDIDVISVDSALVYRGMDIGTAKPSPDELAEVPHQLIDILEPHQSYNASMFSHDASSAIAKSCAAGRLPVLVGGTMLYFRALQQGLADLPDADPTLRAEIDAQAAVVGWPAMHAELASLDPATAARLQPGDAQRIQRALEVCRLAGEPMSQLLQQSAQVLQADYLNIGLIPGDRAQLHARIEQRLRTMLDAGFVAEVERLAALPNMTTDTPAMRAVGYRQFLMHINGDIEFSDALDNAIVATRRLAKRQLTWLRGWPDLHEIDCLAPDRNERVVTLLTQWLQ